MLLLVVASGCSVRGDSAKPTATPDDIFVIVTPTPGTPASGATKSARTNRYVVQAGDSLSDIAEQFGLTLKELQDANNIENPDSIYVGQILKIPEPGS